MSGSSKCRHDASFPVDDPREREPHEEKEKASRAKEVTQKWKGVLVGRF
jgi:hypothetical protein